MSPRTVPRELALASLPFLPDDRRLVRCGCNPHLAGRLDCGSRHGRSWHAVLCRCRFRQRAANGVRLIAQMERAQPVASGMHGLSQCPTFPRERTGRANSPVSLRERTGQTESPAFSRERTGRANSPAFSRGCALSRWLRTLPFVQGQASPILQFVVSHRFAVLLRCRCSRGCCLGALGSLRDLQSELCLRWDC